MRKAILFLLLCILSVVSFAQTPSLQQKLYYTNKVWGFMKYYHLEVSTCHTDWDSVLLHVLPLVRSAATAADFNDALDTMLNAAGPMALSTTWFPDILPAELKRNRDFSWIGASVFRTDVKTILDTVKNNFRPHPGCNIGRSPATRTLYDPSGGYLAFPHDTILLNVNTTVTYPDQDHRMLELFKLWNIIRYFNPYNYALDKSWDTTFTDYVLNIDNAPDARSLSLLYFKIAAAMEDAHVFGLAASAIPRVPGYYQPYIRLKYMGGQYVVTKSQETGIYPGDAIISVDGLNMTQWEDSLKPYYSSGNMSVFRRSVCENVLANMALGSREILVVEDSTGTNHTFSLTCKDQGGNPGFFNNYYYPADSLTTTRWATLDCGIGYMNIGNLTNAGTDSAYDILQNDSVLIVDIRNYPISGSAWELSYRMSSTVYEFARLTLPDTTYPGTYYWEHEYTGNAANPSPYTGKLFILMDEVSQSASEFDCMGLGAFPGAVKVGSQTAGADGNITWMMLSQDMRFGWTSLGVFYPNGDSTQRIGIVPDVVVHPTREGIRHHHDEVLEKAMTIAGCLKVTVPNEVNTVSNSPALNLYPSPATNELLVQASGIAGNATNITITDITGKLLAYKEIENNGKHISASFDIRYLSPGMYFLQLKTETTQFVRKFIKQ